MSLRSLLTVLTHDFNARFFQKLSVSFFALFDTIARFVSATKNWTECEAMVSFVRIATTKSCVRKQEERLSASPRVGQGVVPVSA